MTMDKLIGTCLKNYDTSFFYKVVYSPELDSARIIGYVEGLSVCTTLNFTGEDYDEFYSAKVLDSADRKFPVHEIIEMCKPDGQDFHPVTLQAEPTDFNYSEYSVPNGRIERMSHTEGLTLHHTYADNFFKAVEETSKFLPLKKERLSRPNLANSWVHLDLNPHRNYKSPISVISTDGHRLHLANISGNSFEDIRGDIFTTENHEPQLHRIPVPCSLITALKPTVAIDSLVIYPDGGDVTFLANNRIPVKVSWSKGSWNEKIPDHIPLLLNRWSDYPWLKGFCYEWADISRTGRMLSSKKGDGTVYWWRWPEEGNDGSWGEHSSRSCGPDDEVLDDWNVRLRAEKCHSELKFDEHKRHCHTSFRGKYCYELAKIHEMRTKQNSIDGPTHMLWLGDDGVEKMSEPLRVCWNDVHGGGRMHLLMVKRVTRPNVPKAVSARVNGIT